MSKNYENKKFYLIKNKFLLLTAVTSRRQLLEDRLFWFPYTNNKFLFLSKFLIDFKDLELKKIKLQYPYFKTQLTTFNKNFYKISVKIKNFITLYKYQESFKTKKQFKFFKNLTNLFTKLQNFKILKDSKYYFVKDKREWP